MKPTCEHCDCGKVAYGREATESLWVSTSQPPSFHPLKGDASVDVVIVGAGITGLTTAYLLQKAGRKVMLLDANKLGQGVTGYTSAHLTYVLDAKFQKLVKRFGVKNMKLVQASNRAAIDTIGKIVKDEGIDCDFETVEGYLYTEREKDDEIIHGEVEAAKKIGIHATYTKNVPLPFPTHSGAHFPGQAQFHPLQYIFALAKIIAERGGMIHTDTRVMDVEGRKVITEKGTVTAREIVLATHAPILKSLIGVQAKTTPSKSYIVGIRVSDKEPDALYWDTDHPYQYIRTSKDEKGSVIVIGGKDHPAGMTIDTRKKSGELEAYARKRFTVTAIDYAWSSLYFIPCDDLPYIGKKKGMYVATGYSGNGLTFGTVAALLISDLIVGKENAWAKIYSPNRITLAGMLRLLRYGWNNMKHLFLDRIRKKGRKDPKDIAPGDGAIATVNGKQVALYRDESGKVTTLSPVCTHAGCIVAWNAYEKTWDCPCHGGRFAATGKVINGPPVKDLEKATP